MLIFDLNFRILSSIATKGDAMTDLVKQIADIEDRIEQIEGHLMDGGMIRFKLEERLPEDATGRLDTLLNNLKMTAFHLKEVVNANESVLNEYCYQYEDFHCTDQEIEEINQTVSITENNNVDTEY